MTNLVCVPKKINLSVSFFKVVVETLEWKLKRNGAPVPSGKIFGTRKKDDPYHLDLVLLSPFLTIPSRVLPLLVSNRTC